MEHEETGCQAPEGSILCISNCGFFGSAATMNMCSKCHKDLIFQQEQTKIAASSIESIVNGTSTSTRKEPIVIGNVDILVESVLPKTIITSEASAEAGEPKVGPTRCTRCRKRVGLAGFDCRCGNIFCATHRYSDKRSCPFDYRTEARDAIAKANPVVKADKLDKV